ncbi:MAG: hypothetical protein J6Y31_06200 [Bacteroidales bacterium]|nr:hypothetical protein [Bacteroidales bacterium]
MKKAIFTLVAALSCLFAVSCTRSDMISISLIGRWELFKVETTISGERLEPEYPTQEDRHIFFEFESDDVFVEDIKTPKGLTSFQGSWLVDGDCVIITKTDGTFRYQVEKAHLTELILFRAYQLEGLSYTERLTFKK